MIAGVKKAIKRMVFAVVKPPIKTIMSSYAQAGEDAILRYLFESTGVRHPSYLELGVCKPDIGSNTYLFYQTGSKGVCVEADASLIDKIKAVRSEDVVLNVGVGNEDGKELDFFIFNEPSLNTMNREEAESRERHGTYRITKVVKIKVQTVNTVIADHFPSFPDLLSIDIEGMDLAVLKTLDFERYPIPAICVETCTYSENHIKPKDYSVQDFMLKQGYFIYADTYINTVFVNSKWFYQK